MIGIARRDHQMHVEDLFGVRPERLHHVRADGDVGHEMPVHDIDMDPVGAGRIDGAHLLAEPGEIGREDRWGDDDVFASHIANPMSCPALPGIQSNFFG